MTVANLWYSATSPAPFVVHLFPFPFPFAFPCFSLGSVGGYELSSLASLSPSLPPSPLYRCGIFDGVTRFESTRPPGSRRLTAFRARHYGESCLVAST